MTTYEKKKQHELGDASRIALGPGAKLANVVVDGEPGVRTMPEDIVLHRHVSRETSDCNRKKMYHVYSAMSHIRTSRAQTAGLGQMTHVSSKVAVSRGGRSLFAGKLAGLFADIFVVAGVVRAGTLAENGGTRDPFSGVEVEESYIKVDAAEQHINQERARRKEKGSQKWVWS